MNIKQKWAAYRARIITAIGVIGVVSMAVIGALAPQYQDETEAVLTQVSNTIDLVDTLLATDIPAAEAVIDIVE